MNLKIDKGIEIPVLGELAAQLQPMEVGDSVVVETTSQASSILTTLRRSNRKGTQRKLEDGAYRVWRIE